MVRIMIRRNNMNGDRMNMAVSFGIVLGLSMLVFAYLSMFFGVGGAIVALMSSLYMGYAASYMGGLIGLVYGFVHGFVMGYVFAFASDFVKSRFGV
jgi:hypothetical protein